MDYVKMNQPVLSVITTVYNCEEYLSRCIESVLNSTYKNIELIIVDDKSPGNVAEIVAKYSNIPNVYFVQNQKNLGLFHSRLEGARHAKGDYLAFIDADDHVSVDFYRTLVRKSLDTDSDIVLGDFLNEFDEPKHHYTSRKTSKVRKNDLDLNQDEIRDLFFTSRGMELELNYMWAKLIRRDLWEKCIPVFDKIEGNIINTEDILFSSVLYWYAEHLTNCHGDYYYYRKNSSLNQKKTFVDIQKDIQNNIQTFSFIQDFLKSQKCCKYDSEIWSWYFFYINLQKEVIEISDISASKKKKLFEIIDKIDFPKGAAFPRQEADYLFSPESYDTIEFLFGENIKKCICDKSVKVVSFDIFDTLLTRPFYYPTDLFCLLEIFANKILKITDKMRFRDMRCEAEYRARQKIKLSHPMYEDINIDEIYEELQKLTGWENEIIEKIKEEELKIELKYCKQRSYAKELFDLAKYAGKKVVLTSDMYLPKNFLEKLLEKNGFSGYEHLYVSSEERITKCSGNLFRKIVRALNIKPQEMLHIGDNGASDISSAKKTGVKTEFLPRTVNVLTNQAGWAFWGGEVIHKVYEQSFLSRRAGTFNDFFGIRTMLAVVANRLFDNPFLPFDKKSDFNSSPFIIGYFPLGMHLFALGRWLHEELKLQNFKAINFMARDGYLPMEVFKTLNRIYKNPIQINFLHLSRKTIFPMQIKNADDIFTASTNLNLWVSTPKKIIEVLNVLIDDEKLANVEKTCNEKGFLYDQYFPNQSSFLLFCKFFKEELFSNEKACSYQKNFKANFARFFEGKTATFDIGYSCRIESLLKNLFDYDITPFYIHINNEVPLYRAKKEKIRVNTFLNYESGVTGLQRELFISKLEGSLVSYRNEGDKLVPVTAKIEYNKTAQTIISEIQNAALHFVTDITEIFGDDIKYLFFTHEDASLPYEYFLTYPKTADKYLFTPITIEDELGTGDGQINFNEYWNTQLKNMPKDTQTVIVDKSYGDLKNIKSKWLKFLYLLAVDRKTLKAKMRNRYENNPFLFKLFRLIYRAGRKIYRFLVTEKK